MNIYDKLDEQVINKYWDRKRNIVARTREDKEHNIYYIQREIEDFLYDEEVFDVRVSLIAVGENTYSLSWCGLIEENLYFDHFAVYDI